MTVPVGFNVFGHVSGSLGLSEVARSTSRLLLREGWPVSISDLPVPGWECVLPPDLDAVARPLREAMPYAINVFHVQPHVVIDLIKGPLALQPCERRLSAVVPFWELTRFPHSWVDQLDAVDYVLAPSRHIQSVIEEAAPAVPVLHFPQSVPIPEHATADRARWNLDPGETVFLTSFDVLSDLPRKNPEASILAFEAAFPDRRDVQLLIKMRNADVDARYAKEVASLRAHVAADERIQLLERDLSDEELTSLFASVDALVSLHRAEGLGLMLMRCMAVGTPVIGTAWSGNLDFMDESNSALVGYSLVPAKGLHDYYDEAYLGGPALWAEPSIPDAARWMLAFADDSPLRKRIGEKARSDSIRREADAARRAPFEALAEAFGQGFLRSARHRLVRRCVTNLRYRGLMRAAVNPRRVGHLIQRVLGRR